MASFPPPTSAEETLHVEWPAKSKASLVPKSFIGEMEWVLG